MKNNRKWNARYAVDAYRLSKKGCNDKGIYVGLAIAENTFRIWRRSHPSFSYAIEKGRSDRELDGYNSLSTFILARLSPEVRSLWEKINFWCNHARGPVRIDAMLAGQGKQVRQALWLQAYLSCGFNASKACRLIGVSRALADQWRSDSGFAELIDEFIWHRKNFFEEALVDLVAARNPTAIIFANRTVNRDRGYGDVAEMDRVAPTDRSVPIDQLKLPLETRREILQALRAYHAKEAAAQRQPVSEA